MARPITWQNVNSPQGAASIEALLRSGRQAGAGFEAMGDVFRTARDEMQAAATGAAVAQIANSNDPLAAAAAAPKTWQFDPLAIATAANARGEQIQESEAREQTIATARAAMDMSRAQLKDLEDTRLSEAIVQRSWDASAKAGRPVLSEEDANLGQASIKAGKELEARLDTLADNRRGDAELNLRQREARLREEDRKRSEALRAAKAELVLRGASETGAKQDPRGYNRLVLEVFKQFGADPSAVDEGIDSFKLGLSGNQALQVERDLEVPGGRGETFGTYENALNAEEQATKQKQAVRTSRFAQRNNTAANLAKSEFADMTEEAAAFALAQKYGWDPDNARDRMKEAQDSAPEGVTLTPAMKAEIAAATSGSFRGWLKDSWANSPAAQARLEEYVAFQQAGGIEALTHEQGILAQEFAAEDAQLAEQRRLLNYAMRNGDPNAIPVEIRRAYLRQQQAERDALEKKLREDQRLAAEAEKELKRREKLEEERQKRRGPDDWASWRR